MREGMHPRRSAALIAALAGCTGPALVEVTGSVAMTGVAGGDWTITPTTCQNHGNPTLPDADATDGESAVTLALDDTGAYTVTISTAWANDGVQRTARLTAGDCGQLDAQLEEGQAVTRRYVYILSTGSLALDCSWPTGGRVTGALQFVSCEGPQP